MKLISSIILLFLGGLIAHCADLKLPRVHILKNVPMVQQKGNYCVPASAAMIAGFHKIKTNQEQLAELSSEMSASNLGTYPSDMILAMQKLGFVAHALQWKDRAAFKEEILPEIRRALYETGPIYISFRPNVFGSIGHGCVIVGFDDRKEELHFYNPWGSKFEKTYGQVAVESNGLVLIEAPKSDYIATDAFTKNIRSKIPRFEGDFLDLSARLNRLDQPHKLVWCSRRDAHKDKRFAQNTARENGRLILELAFERNPAVLIPYSEDGVTRRYLFVTRPPEGGARFLVRSIDKQGWSQAQLQTLGSLTRHWATAFITKEDEAIWELPMIELRSRANI